MVERSAPLPMRIDIHIRPCFADGLELLATSKLLLTCPRIRTLRISGYRADILSILDRLCSPTPLEALDLWVMAYATDDVNLPVALFGGEAPHFRHLKFETIARIRAPGWLLAGVTHFTASAVFSLHELLDMLQAMPQLEVLCVMEIIDLWRETDPHEHVPPRRATLPRLSLLSFHDITPRRFVTFSSRIDAPPTLCRHLSWRVGAVSSWDEWAGMFTAMQALVPGDSVLGVNDGGLRVARMGEYGGGSFEVWSRTCSESASMAAREAALFMFHVDWSHNVADPRRADGIITSLSPSFLLASLCVHLRTAHIEDLTIASATAIEGAGTAGEGATVAAQWQALLAALPSVTTMRLQRGSPACVSVLRALSASAEPLLPHLQRVFVVHSAVHSAAPVRPDGAGPVGPGRKFVQANVGPELVEAVSGRSGLEVVLAGCEVHEETLDALQKRARVYIGHERVYV